jgi:hypothetical protein
MGYNFYITRKQMHFDTLGQVIKEEEWTTYIKNDPELKLAGFNSPFFVLWSGKCSYEEPWFDCNGSKVLLLFDKLMNRK